MQISDDESGGGSAHALRQVLGMLLLIPGAGIACWVAYTAIGLLGGDTQVPLLQHISHLDPGANLISTSRDAVELPPAFFLTMGLGAVIALLTICTALAGMLIRGGVQLLQPDIRALLRRLRRQAESG